MKQSYSMACKQHGGAVVLLVSASLIIATVMVCMVTKGWALTNSVLFFTTSDPNVHPSPKSSQQNSVVGINSSSIAISNRSSEELVPLQSAPVDWRVVYNYSTDERLVLDATNASRRQPYAAVAPKIAFLFLVRGEIPFEPLWRRYFAGHEERYSVYVHAAPNFTFPSSSFFSGKQIPSRNVKRMDRSLADAVRRLLAMALLDWERNNVWYVNVCEATIPLRSFNSTYAYLMGSRHSFVQAFQPSHRYLGALPHISPDEDRKGEVWMALNRKHALAILEDRSVYAIFVQECRRVCSFDERYFQTLLSMRDPGGVANRTVMFVDWSGWHGSSPRSFDARTTNASLLHAIASMTEDSVYGQHHDTAFQQNHTVHCAHNGFPGAACFLFARKFDASALDAAAAWLSHVQEFESQLPRIITVDVDHGRR